MKIKYILLITLTASCLVFTNINNNAYADFADEHIAWVSDGHGMYDAVYNNGKGPESAYGSGPAPITKAQYEAMKHDKSGSHSTDSGGYHGIDLSTKKNVKPVTINDIKRAQRKAQHHKKVIKERRLTKQRNQKLKTIHGLLLIAGGIAITGVLIAWAIDFYKHQHPGEHPSKQF